jgi:hypothetical protein
LSSMAEAVPDAAGNIMVQRPNLQAPAQKGVKPQKPQAAPPIATKYTPAVAAPIIAPFNEPPPPAPVVSTAASSQAAKSEQQAIIEQPKMGSKDTLLPKKENEKEKEKPHESDGKWFYANFEPWWILTLILVIIGTLMCPVLGAIGLVFAILAKCNGFSPLDGDPRLKLAEGCNKCACHLGVGAIIAGFIILGTLVAVLIFLFSSSAKQLVTGTV